MCGLCVADKRNTGRSEQEGERTAATEAGEEAHPVKVGQGETTECQITAGNIVLRDNCAMCGQCSSVSAYLSTHSDTRATLFAFL